MDGEVFSGFDGLKHLAAIRASEYQGCCGVYPACEALGADFALIFTLPAIVVIKI
jgi:hypothetical protein